MDILTFILLLAAGCAAGFLGGFFGIGGGILTIPVLLFYYQQAHVTSLVSTHLAFGTNLLIVIFAAASSTYQHNREQHVIWRGVLLWGSAAAVGALAGSFLAATMQGNTLRQIFAGFVAVAAIRLLAQPRKPKGNLPPDLSLQRLIPAGALIGFAASLAGLGGGVLAVPILYSLLHFPLKKALGTSSGIVVLSAFAGAIGYALRGWEMQGLPPHTLGYVDYISAIPLIIGSLPLAIVGANMAENTRANTLRKVFALLLIVVAAKMFLG